MAPAIGSRRLTVLREFRPHGLAAEEADGEGGPGERPPQDYDYFLFDPALAASPAPEPGEEAASSSSGADGDHELFIRGNRIIWSAGSRVHKRYLSPNTVIMVRLPVFHYHMLFHQYGLFLLAFYFRNLLMEAIWLDMMKDFDEKTIWTSDIVPLMASYHKGKFQHSVWQIDGTTYQEEINDNAVPPIPCDISMHKFAFRKIWQGKCSQSAASKVFLATDIDGTPIICFLLHEQKILLAVRFQVDENNGESFGDIKPHMSWNIPALAAAPVVVTRPRAWAGVLPFTDILILTPDNDLLLYSGKQCLCRYTLPTELGKGIFSNYELNSGVTEFYSDMEITSITDAVEGRINVTCSNGLMLRCSLRKSPSSSLVSDCITAMAEGLQSCFYSHFVSLLWGDSDAAYLCSSSHVDSEWESFSYEVEKICAKYGQISPAKSSESPCTAWDFLINSKHHAKYGKQSRTSLPMSYNTSSMSFHSFPQDGNSADVSFYIRFISETLDTLHALYENLKLNILRKQDLASLASLLCRVASSLGENSYVDYYCRDFPDNLVEFHSLSSATALRAPPCLFRWLENCLRHGCDLKTSDDIPALMCKEKSSAALDKCRESPPDDWPAPAYVLVGRDDLAMARMGSGRRENGFWNNDNLTSISVPYMLHLQPVTVLTTALDVPPSEILNSEDTDSVYRSVEDGMEHIFTSTTQLRYGRDLRLNEVRRLLCSARPVAIQTPTNPSVSDQDLQQQQLWNFAQRTTALPFGRGAFTLATTYTLLTEALVFPKLVLAGRLPAQQNATVNLDLSSRSVSEFKSWAEFHNGVAAGLRLAPFQEHDITRLGLLLGLAASNRGTMHPAISKMLYFHVPSRHPSSTPELELPTLLQGEIGRRSGGDNVLEREGYAVAAGSALGLVALGRGSNAFGFMDTFLDRLFEYIGSKEVYHEKHLNAAIAADEQSGNTGQMMEGAQINVDVTAPGAIIALALIFLKAESEEIAARLSVPNSHFDLQYVRPDFVMLRIVARNLILWNRIQPTKDWVESQVPSFVNFGVSNTSQEAMDSDELDSEALFQAYVNIVTGACIALGLKYAGSRNSDAQELLYAYAVHFLNEIKHISIQTASILPKGLLQHVDRGTLELCLHLIVLSLSLVMAGSGHLQTFRLLRYLRGRSSAEGQVSLAIGFLFLGGGTHTFSTSNSAVAALLITLYPQPRWIQTVDVDTGLPVYCPLEVTVAETEYYDETNYCEVTPCLLPERSVLKNIRVCGPRYWSQVITLTPEDKPWWKSGDRTDPFNGGVLYIKRKVGSCSYSDDPIGCQSLLSRAMHEVCDTPSTSCSNQANSATRSSLRVDQLVSTFSANPSLIAFAKLCCQSWKDRRNGSFEEFCSQILYECMSKDRPALLQVYISFYTIIETMWEHLKIGHFPFSDSLFLSSLKVASAYNEALIDGRITTGGIIQSTFLESLMKRIEYIFAGLPNLHDSFINYLNKGKWPDAQNEAVLLSWYLQWYSIPPPHIVSSAIEKVKPRTRTSLSMLPLLRLQLPTTHLVGLMEIEKLHMTHGHEGLTLH
uniref:Uncharacterized protein n=1 Tax=Oryza nivara TaxID=4536 RepID=A0A0E0HD67_ORYNI